MSSIRPSNGPPEPPPPPPKSSQWKAGIIFTLKVLGAIALVLLVVAGIILGTCMYTFRNLR